MKRIISHHDGHGRMERLIVLATDEPATEPPGNSSHHHYDFFALPKGYPDIGDVGPKTAFDLLPAGPGGVPVASIQFQRGPFDAEGSTPGTLGAAVVAALIDHFQGFLGGPLANRETALAVTKLQEALFWLRQRADERAARGVLGTMSK